MNDIKELVDLVAKHSPEAFPLLQLKAPKLNKEATLFIGVRDNAYQSDEEAAAAMYQTSPSDSRYIIAKFRLKKALMNHVLFLNNQNTVAKAEQQCLINLTQASILMDHSKYTLALGVLKDVLRVAKEFEFTTIIINCLHLQRRIYSYNNNYNLFYRVQEELHQYYEVESAERKADEIYRLCFLELNRSVNGRSKFLPKVDHYLKILGSLSEQYSSNAVIFHQYVILKLWKWVWCSPMLGQRN